MKIKKIAAVLAMFISLIFAGALNACTFTAKPTDTGEQPTIDTDGVVVTEDTDAVTYDYSRVSDVNCGILLIPENKNTVILKGGLSVLTLAVLIAPRDTNVTVRLNGIRFTAPAGNYGISVTDMTDGIIVRIELIGTNSVKGGAGYDGIDNAGDTATDAGNGYAAINAQNNDIVFSNAGALFITGGEGGIGGRGRDGFLNVGSYTAGGNGGNGGSGASGITARNILSENNAVSVTGGAGGNGGDGGNSEHDKRAGNGGKGGSGGSAVYTLSKPNLILAGGKMGNGGKGGVYKGENTILGFDTAAIYGGAAGASGNNGTDWIKKI